MNGSFAFIMVVFWGKCPNLIWYFIMEYQNNDIIRFMTLFYNYFFLKTTWIQVFDCDTINNFIKFYRLYDLSFFQKNAI